MKKIIPLATILVFAFYSCAASDIANIDTEKSRPIRKIENYNGNIQAGIENRILDAPPLVLDYLNKMDSTDKYKPYVLSKAEKQLFLSYYKLLPAKYRAVMENKVIAIYFIQDFTGGGMSDFLFDREGEMYMVLYLNADILHATLTEWINYRDNSTFADDDSSVTVRADCGDKYLGLLHTLIHEASHIYDYYYHVTPYVEPVLISPGDAEKATLFIKGIWQEYRRPFPLYDFKYRTDISSYGLGKQLPRALAGELYTSLNKTPFSSLYGSSAWMEDFAETFAWYYLHKYLKIKYEVTVYLEGKAIVRFSPAGNKLVMDRYDQFQKGKEEIALEGIYPYQAMLNDMVSCEESGLKSRMDLDIAVDALNMALAINEQIRQ